MKSVQHWRRHSNIPHAASVIGSGLNFHLKAQGTSSFTVRQTTLLRGYGMIGGLWKPQERALTALIPPEDRPLV